MSVRIPGAAPVLLEEATMRLLIAPQSIVADQVRLRNRGNVEEETRGESHDSTVEI